jgi:hypothetical protein
MIEIAIQSDNVLPEPKRIPRGMVIMSRSSLSAILSSSSFPHVVLIFRFSCEDLAYTRRSVFIARRSSMAR